MPPDSKSSTKPPGREPETNLRSVWTGKGQHRSTHHNDPSSKMGKTFEMVVGHTIFGRHPVYRNHSCGSCGAPVRWLSLNDRAGNLGRNQG